MTWDTFGIENGAPTFDEMVTRIGPYRRSQPLDCEQTRELRSVMAVTYENPPALGAPLGKYSHLSRAGDLVLIAGQVGVRPDGSLAGEDFRSQLLQVFENLRLALESVGGGFGSVMKFTTYLVGEAAIAEFREARDELYPRIYPSGTYPPNTLLVVQGLVRPEFLLEIDAMAWVPASGR